MQTGSSIWQQGTPKVADGGFAAAGVKDAGDYTTDEVVDPSFNDLGWRTVDVPHDFSIEGEKVKSSSDARRLIWKADLAITVKRFTVPASMSGNKTISLDFEGVYQNSVVLLKRWRRSAAIRAVIPDLHWISRKVKYGEEERTGCKSTEYVTVRPLVHRQWYHPPVHLLIDNQAHFNRNGITLTTPTLEGRLYSIQDRCTEYRSNRLF